MRFPCSLPVPSHSFSFSRVSLSLLLSDTAECYKLHAVRNPEEEIPFDTAVFFSSSNNFHAEPHSTQTNEMFALAVIVTETRVCFTLERIVFCASGCINGKDGRLLVVGCGMC